MATGRFRFSLLELCLLVALVAILVRAGILLTRPRGTPNYSVSALSFSPGGQSLAASLFCCHRYSDGDHILGVDASQSFFILDVPDLRVSAQFGRTEKPGDLGTVGLIADQAIGQSVAFSPDGHTLAVEGLDNRVSLWSAAANRRPKLERAFEVPDGLTESLGWTGDGTLAASAMNAVYSLSPNASQFREACHAESAFGMAISRDGQTLAVANDNIPIELWDGTRLNRLDPGSWAGMKSVPAVSLDGTKLAYVDYTGWGNSQASSICVWDMATGKKLRSWDGSNVTLRHELAFSPDGQTLLVASGNELRFYPLDSREHQTVKSGEYIASVAFSPDGTLLATGDHEGSVELWDLKTKTVLNRVSLVTETPALDWPLAIAASAVWIFLWRKSRRANTGK